MAQKETTETAAQAIVDSMDRHDVDDFDIERELELLGTVTGMDQEWHWGATDGDFAHIDPRETLRAVDEILARSRPVAPPH